jgi:hypothetical protein
MNNDVAKPAAIPTPDLRNALRAGILDDRVFCNSIVFPLQRVCNLVFLRRFFQTHQDSLYSGSKPRIPSE